MAAYNRRLAQWRVKLSIDHSTSRQLLWYINSEALRNPPLLQAPKRTQQAKEQSNNLEILKTFTTAPFCYHPPIKSGTICN